MITAELNESAKAMIAKDYVCRLEEENAKLLRRLVARKADMKKLLEWLDDRINLWSGRKFYSWPSQTRVSMLRSVRRHIADEFGGEDE